MLYWKVIMPLTKFYITNSSKTNKFLYFIKNNKVFLINQNKNIRKSYYKVYNFTSEYSEPFIEAETPEEAMDIYMLLVR